MSRQLFVTLAVILFAFSASADSAARYYFAQPNASAPPPPPTEQLLPRTPFQKPSGEQLQQWQQDQLAIVKFVDGTSLRWVDGQFGLTPGAVDYVRAARQGVTAAGLESDLTSLNAIIHSTTVSVSSVLSTPLEALTSQRAAGEWKTRRQLPDVSLFYLLSFPDKTPPGVADILYELNNLSIVEYAGPTVKSASPPTDIPPATPNFSGSQGYFAAAPTGIDVNYARLLIGGHGEGLRIVDVEDGCILDHEDFPPLLSFTGVNYAPFADHGTAVIGVLAAGENGYGVTGIAPSSQIAVASPVTAPDNGYQLADGIQRAIDQSREGDLILIEQQVYYNYPSDQAFCPPEWDPAAFSVIQIATANSRVVIETAGNGSQNLDNAARFGSYFDRSAHDSGAIIVGAGSSSSHAPLSFSNYGSRLDVQGWGENVATLGYGDLFYPTSDPRQAYTSVFNGTSSAGPVVAGAAALIQAVRSARGLTSLSSQDMRAALLVGATPQAPGVHIGPLPNLRPALVAVPVPSPSIVATGDGTGSVTVSWSAVPGVNGYEVFRKDTHTGAWNSVSTTSNLSVTNSGLPVGKAFVYRVRAYDGAGNRSSDSNLDLATTITFSDAALSSAVVVKARHITEVRLAVNAVCEYAGASICPSAPYGSAATDEVAVRGGPILAEDFAGAAAQIASLRNAIGVFPSPMRENPLIGIPIRIIHLEDLRAGAN